MMPRARRHLKGVYMLDNLIRASLIGGLGAMGLIVSGCRVDAVVYAPAPAVVVEDQDADVVVTDEPPPAPYEVVPVAPYPDAIWIGGDYVFVGGHYVWNHGHYERRPYGYHRWVAGGWRHGPHGYVRARGHWE
jgi:hypothetical protein